MEEADAKTIIDATMVPGKGGVVFCLGPFGARVNFIAQQTRALNLVSALQKDRRIHDGHKVAVVGAGVAGLTAAAALVAHKCNVDVFERADDSVGAQRFTDHRLIHPTVNQWPARNLELTTTLPFLEWFAGPCSAVAEDIAQQFDALKGTSIRFFEEHTVTDITDMGTKLIGLVVEPRIDPIGYNLVILTVGFGNETAPPKFTPIPYWFPDGLEAWKTMKVVKRFLISGCGDGGLIDALRLVHSDFRKGKLAFELAHDLTGSELAAAIVAAEEDAKNTGDHARLAASYKQFAGTLNSDPRYSVISERLRMSLRKAGTVYLIDRSHEDPYSLKSAPIHKLMIAHAREVHKIIYRRGSPKKKGNVISFAEYEFPASELRIVVRHGPQPSFGHLISKTQAEELKRRQEAISDFSAAPRWSEPYPAPSGLPQRDLDDGEFIESRLALVRRAIRTIDENAEVTRQTRRIRVDYDRVVPAHAPAQLFGIPLVNEVERTVKPIS